MAKANTIPAATGERFQYMARSGNDTTVRFVVHYPGLLDADCFRRAVEALVFSVDVLHSSIEEGIHAIRWRVHNHVDTRLLYRQLDVLSQDSPEWIALMESVKPVLPTDPCQLRCTLVQNQQRCAIVLCVSHLVADGGDARYLLYKLAEAYERIRTTGSAEGLHVKNGSRSPEQLYSHLQGEEARNLYKLPYSSKATSTYPYPTEEDGSPRAVLQVISREVMAAAREKAKAIGATANDLLLSAAYQVYAAFPEVDRHSGISISSMRDARWMMPGGESQGLCNMSGSLMTALEAGVPDTFEQTLAAITRQTQAAKDDRLSCLAGLPLLHRIARQLPLWLQNRLSKAFYRHMPVGLTNMGNVSCVDLSMGGLIPTGGAFGGPLKKKPGMQVSILSFDGECTLASYGRFTDQDAAHVQKTLEDMAQVISDYAAQ